MLKAAFICGSGSGGDNPVMMHSGDLPSACDRPRTPRTGRRTLLLALGGCLLVAAVQAGGRDDHDRARAAVQAGQILALPVVLERLQRSHPGQVLELELEQDKGRWIYEIRLVQPDGQLLKLTLDAATAQVLEVRRR